MPRKRFALQILTGSGLALVALILTIMMPAFVWAAGPKITIVKEANQVVASGDDATFTITITNSGDITLTNVTVVDAETPDCERNPPDLVDLAPGESTGYTCTHFGVTQSFTNLAAVTGTLAGDTATVADSDTATVTVSNPGIEVEIAPLTQIVNSGSSANFTIIVTNTGNVDLMLNPDDPPASAPTCDSGTYPASDVPLNVLQQVTYTCVKSVPDGFINWLTVEGIPSVGPSVTASDAAAVILTEAATQCSPSDMIAYWKFDETSGSTYDDYYSGHDAECAASGICPTSLTEGRVNGAQTFNGSTTRVDVPVDPGNTFFDWGKDDSFSIEFWMRGVSGQTCASSNEVIVGRDENHFGGLHWWLGCNSSGRATFELRDNNFQGKNLASSQSVIDGDWHHIVGVRIGGASDINRLYVDGAQVASVSHDYGAGFESSTSVPLNIGWLNWDPFYHFEGDVDELAIYNKALSSAEIQNHYNSGIPGPSYCGGPFAPRIISTAPTVATIGQPFTYTVVAVGDPNPTYNLTLNPTAMIIDSNSGVISWTPTISDQGSNNVTVMAVNSGGDDTQNFTIQVNAEGDTANTVYLPVVLK
jgi:hypothetical protein